MVDSESLFESSKEFIGPVLKIGVWGIAKLIALGIIAVIAIWAKKRKKWNLRVEIKLPRSDGLLINSEKGKGYFDTKGGFVSLKRKGLPPIDMKPFNVNKYLQGNNYLEVEQIGPYDFIPIHPRSYTIIKDEIDGEEHALLDIEGDMGERRQWASNAAENAINRFTLKGFLDKHWKAIELTIIMFGIFVGFAIVLSQMP